MIRIADIQQSMQHLVGWENTTDPSKIVNPSLETSDSGLYFQHAHPMLTLDNIRSVMPDESYVAFGNYDATEAVKKGAIRVYDSKKWISRADSTGVTPGTDATKWEVYDQLSEYLSAEVRIGVSTMVNQLMTTKESENAVKSLFEHKYLFDGAGRKQCTIQNSNRIVGFEIEPIRGIGITTQLHKLGMQFVGATGTLKVYLFHTSHIDPIKTWTLNLSQTANFQWFDLGETMLPYVSSGNNAGGCWYICYSQKDFANSVMEAVNVNKDWSKEPCSECNKGNVKDWRVMTKYIRISPFTAEVPEDFSTNPQLFDTANVAYTPTFNYGMNMEISIGCDITDFIVSQKQLFANCLQKQVAVNLLRKIAYNPNVNVDRNQLNASRQELLMELDGNTYTRSSGLKGDLKKAYDALKVNTTGMDSACLPCQKSGIRITIA